MRKSTVAGLMVLTAAIGGIQVSQAAPTNAKPLLPVVAGAKALSAGEKADVTGKGASKCKSVKKGSKVKSKKAKSVKVKSNKPKSNYCPPPPKCPPPPSCPSNS